MRRNKKSGGFTLVEIMIVVMIIATLMEIAVPGFVHARNVSRKTACIANLKKIDSSKEQFAMANMLDTGAAVTSANIAPTYLKTFPVCQGGGTYTINVIGTNPSCSLSAKGHVIP